MLNNLIETDYTHMIFTARPHCSQCRPL